MRIHEILTEKIAMPVASASQTFFHGTPIEAKAHAIIEHGLLPQDPALKGQKARGMMTPVKGMIYLTPNVRYALIYALGGSFVGRDPMPSVIEETGRYGYLFEVSGTALSMVQPDEDEIGEAVRDSFKVLRQMREKPDTRPKHFAENVPFGDALVKDVSLMRELVALAQSYLTPGQQHKVFTGYEYGILAQAGKKLAKAMPDAMKTKLITMGCHVAHEGGIRPSACYRIDKTRSADLGFQGEHWREVADRL